MKLLKVEGRGTCPSAPWLATPLLNVTTAVL